MARARLPRVGSDARFRAEDDLRTLKNAEEVKADSKRLSNAKKVGAQQMAAIKKVVTKKVVTKK